jgi:dipeptidyl aminopeptidase/acylaminoacyl peptidase
MFPILPKGPQLAAVFLVILAPLLHAREWTNEKGVKITADFVSSDGVNVTLSKAPNSPPIVYPLAKLSSEDQEFVKSELQKAEALIRKGLILDFPIKAWHPAMADYFAEKHAKRLFDYFTSPKLKTWKENIGTASEQFDYDATTAQTIVFVPKTYNGQKPFGVYIHLSPGDGADKGTAYQATMEKFNLIYISPKGTSNDRPMLRKVHLAVDALDSVRKEWKIDPKRIVVGGLSGGGHMAMLTQAVHPELFLGAVSHAAQSYLPSFPPAYYSFGHFPGLLGKDFSSGALKEQKWVVISGEKDKNYQDILKTTKEWEAHNLAYKFINVPGMAHTNAAVEPFEEALKWVGL